MAYLSATVTVMSAGYLLSAVVSHLPLLAVLVAGLVVVSVRRAHLGPRSVMFARLGLGLLLASQLLNMVWLAVFPHVVESMAARSSYTMVSASVGIVLSLLLAAGVGLLVTAVVTRAPASAPGVPAAPGAAFPAPGYSAYPAPYNAPHDPTAYPPGT
ncbi:hypothetical protein EDD30_5247 [Couchioplanes caeruleus]|uniref:Uncharacterized protein n=1 Tax=Couchioplanes caeruleus TaxID=56438 RepID=A0A3N1GPY8_9ACTN|nr:hypothetical protein EDD30_5247 [Couchioplanes caeruleus]